ncbi:FAD/NAD(P)-binding:oxidoreductase [Desulforhopalus sp. IMCC35007]|nr:FAD/NAD(P)-binding:oxidoreductase [Desulforhopalus sp. IMCC35007]
MGLIMKENTQKKTMLPLAVLFIGLPLFFYATGDFPKRTPLKDSLSVLTILAFCLMLAQFYLTRMNRSLLGGYRQSTITTIHKALGYIFLPVLIIHPFLIVVPRYYESGVSPTEAFFTIITTFSSFGIILGICAWCLMVILGVASLFRTKLSLSYKTWRLIHTILAVLFIVAASWHAIDLGRHTDTSLSTFIIIVAAGSLLLVLKHYISESLLKQEPSK